MQKTEAIKLFGTKAELARELGVSRQRVSQATPELSDRLSRRVIGAALRTGKMEWPQGVDLQFVDELMGSIYEIHDV